jgi:hypothetical protein
MDFDEVEESCDGNTCAGCRCSPPSEATNLKEPDGFEFEIDDGEEHSNFIKHAKREFQALGYDLDDKEEGPNKWIMESIFELLRVFSKQGHSGDSAPYCISVFEKLARFEPLCPLSGNDDEWNEVGNGVFQNNRCSHVFKQADRFNGQAYDIDGKVFREPDGCCYTSNESFVPITFPYTPKTEYIDVPAPEKDEEDTETNLYKD